MGLLMQIGELASQAGCEVLVLTADVPVRGNREYNDRNGFGMPLRLGWRSVAGGLAHPAWLVDVYLRSILGRKIGESRTRRDLHDWNDFVWLRATWPGKLVVKGVLSAEDAHLAVQHGADGILVSNHGGRQLDGAVSSIRALPEVVDAVGNELEVWFDGGIRSGQDVLRALALGARGTLIGRAFAYGLGAMGEAGVTRALEVIEKELDVTLALCGLRDVRDASRAILRAA